MRSGDQFHTVMIVPVYSLGSSVVVRSSLQLSSAILPVHEHYICLMLFFAMTKYFLFFWCMEMVAMYS
jgi:hypothetical protein